MLFLSLIPPALTLASPVAIVPLSPTSERLSQHNTAISTINPETREALLAQINLSSQNAISWSNNIGLSHTEASCFAIFAAIRSQRSLGLRSQPCEMTELHVSQAMGFTDETLFSDYFSFDDLSQATEVDFLDAGQGTTDMQRGWKSEYLLPTCPLALLSKLNMPKTGAGSLINNDIFEEARMTIRDIKIALESGTVIFNAAGAHIPKLAHAAIAGLDATSLPNALNMYVTAPGIKTSAPPHTDNQDVLVVQTSGSKHWKVYAPPDPRLKPEVDMFARGKVDDHLSLFELDDVPLLDITLKEGDILFIPAGFPHTTDTESTTDAKVSIHLTFGIDTHIWGLDYVSLRSLALKRAGLDDELHSPGNTSLYTGNINELSIDLRTDLFESLPIGFLEAPNDIMLEAIVKKCQDISGRLDSDHVLSKSLWKESTERLRQHGRSLLDIHREMYMAAIKEGRLRGRRAEKNQEWTAERIERVSVFRVKRYEDQIEACKTSLETWSTSYHGTFQEEESRQ